MVYILFGCLSSWYLTGLSWTIGVVTYPGFSLIGTSEWHRFHEFHSRRIALAVGPMWAVEMLASALWVLRAPQGTQVLSIVAGVAALSTVALTVFWAVPAHNRHDDSVVLTRREPQPGPSPPLAPRLPSAST